jgi:virginiamycin B lyase
MGILRSTALALTLLGVAAGPATAAPTVTSYPGMTAPGAGIATGPDGNLWVTEPADPGRVARISNGGATVDELSAKGGGLLGILGDPWHSNKSPVGMAAGPDGAIWFVENGYDAAVRVTMSGNVNEIPMSAAAPTSIAAGPDGNLWVTSKDAINRVTPGGSVTEFKLGLTSNSDPTTITAGPDGAMWFTERASGAIGRITMGGTITEYAVPTAGSAPTGIAAGPDGALWFTEAGGAGAIGRITTDGAIREFAAGLSAGAAPVAITAGPDDALWFAGKGMVGRITTGGMITEMRSGLPVTADLVGIAKGPDGALWLTDASSPVVRRIAPGPSAAMVGVTKVEAQRALLSATVRPNGSDTTVHVALRDDAGGSWTSTSSGAGNGLADVAVSISLTGLAPETTYHASLVASSVAGVQTSAEISFTTSALPVVVTPTPTATPTPDATTAPTPVEEAPSEPSAPADSPATQADPIAPVAEPVPVLGRTVVLAAERGTILVKVPGRSRYRPLSQTSTLPVGSIVDAVHGTVALTSARNGAGAVQTGSFRGGKFRVRQSGSSGVTDLVLAGGLDCSPRTLGAYVSAAKKRVRRLWGSDRHGRFRTYGRDSVATVRGTRWLTEDRCDGTLVKVTAGAVAVTPTRGGRTVVVRAGGRRFTPHRR